jgi:hypothetical protein
VVFFLPLLNWMAAGFFAALLYRRRTGYLLSLESGVRLGWITGVLTFVIALILLTLLFGMINAVGVDALLNSWPAPLRESFGPQFRESMKSLQSVSAVAEMVVEDFVAITLFSVAGGLLGARMSRREDPAS